ncbi:hypothetical protein F383_20184 [Gossypium arboreum]|uniref:Uncharacterized protein n=1 Tax=Gossypium arboreum TaxID=29729 RepID=A0A0B0NTK6_GOSAR|nr:hypothetical protein F383_20184 [Gossypium arboreum]
MPPICVYTGKVLA